MVTDPDAGMITNLDIFHKVTARNNFPRTFMTTYQRQLGVYWPVAVEGMKIGMADTGST
ncbi:MAG: hypothetical protein M1836_007564 [Candelina mexicana]|nr:MAG: hypothetical protein M1836_007564 [Candelina mexicana]